MQSSRSATMAGFPGVDRASRAGPASRALVAAPPAPAVVFFPRWQAARDRASAALLNGAPCLLVTGPSGTGKTLLLDSIARVLRAAGWTVVLQLGDYSAPAGHNEALLVDEADRLSPAKLEQLLHRTDGPVVLAGLGALERQIPPEVPRIHLVPLGREEARDYIVQWLELTGRTPANLELPAMVRLIELSGGIPRLLSSLLGAAAWLAVSEGETIIRVEQVEETAALRACLTPAAEVARPAISDGQDIIPVLSPRPRRQSPAWLPTLALMGTVAMVGFLAVRLELLDVNPAIESVTSYAATLQAAIRARLSNDDAPKPPTPETKLPEGVVPERAVPESAVEPPAPASAQPPAQATASLTTEVEPSSAEPGSPPAATGPAEEKLPIETIQFLMRRGNALMAVGDVAAARLMFAPAADAGDADAMLAMGMTYDPTVLAGLGAVLPGERAKAIDWYRRAGASGNRRAATLLEHLVQTADLPGAPQHDLQRTADAPSQP